MERKVMRSSFFSCFINTSDSCFFCCLDLFCDALVCRYELETRTSPLIANARTRWAYRYGHGQQIREVVVDISVRSGLRRWKSETLWRVSFPIDFIKLRKVRDICAAFTKNLFVFRDTLRSWAGGYATATCVSRSYCFLSISSILLSISFAFVFPDHKSNDF